MTRQGCSAAESSVLGTTCKTIFCKERNQNADMHEKLRITDQKKKDQEGTSCILQPMQCLRGQVSKHPGSRSGWPSAEGETTEAGLMEPPLLPAQNQNLAEEPDADMGKSITDFIRTVVPPSLQLR